MGSDRNQVYVPLDLRNLLSRHASPTERCNYCSRVQLYLSKIKGEDVNGKTEESPRILARPEIPIFIPTFVLNICLMSLEHVSDFHVIVEMAPINTLPVWIYFKAWIDIECQLSCRAGLIYDDLGWLWLGSSLKTYCGPML